MGIHHALFVPADSTYMKLGASGEAASLAWQHSLRSVWDSIASGGGSVSNGAACGTARASLRLPSPPCATAPGLPAAAAAAGPARSAVLPSLCVALDWLRQCVREVPSLRVQVLVTGSLYLVGDLLKALQQQQRPGQQQAQDATTASGN